MVNPLKRFWPFNPKIPAIPFEIHAAEQPPAPCGQQTSHYYWLEVENFPCPHCARVARDKAKDAEQDALADKIVARLKDVRVQPY